MSTEPGSIQSGHAVGAFIGAFVFEFVKLYAAALLTGAWQLALGLVLIVMVFAAPRGIFGLLTGKARKKQPARKTVSGEVAA